MPSERKVTHLAIYLIKEHLTLPAQIVVSEVCEAPIDIKLSGHSPGQLFVRRTAAVPPRWATLFMESINPSHFAVPGVAAVLLIKVGQRHFALAFGQGGRFLIRDDVFEERFGLLCSLNTLDPKSIRSIDVQSLDAIESHTRIQSGQEATSDQFGLDIEQDMLKAIVGTPLNKSLGSRMGGHDSLSVSIKMNLSDLPFLLDEYRKRFEADLKADDYQWVNNIAIVRKKEVSASLEAALNAKLAARDFEGLWLSIPEIIEWELVKGFMFTNGGKEVYPDINLTGFLKTVKDKQAITVDLLRARQVMCADADHQKVFRAWPVYKCLYAEIDLDGGKYVLNDGKWFSIDVKFVDKTNADFGAIPISGLSLPEYAGGGEGSYNASVAAARPKTFALLDDSNKVMHGGGHGQVEVCDLLSIDRELIHVKIYGKSNVFSHLFAQGFVSGQLIQIDSEFRRKVIAKLKAPFKSLFKVAKKPEQDEFTIVFAVISDTANDELYLPFFSRVNINNTAKILRGFGYKVALRKISVDEEYSKTIKAPPKGKAKM